MKTKAYEIYVNGMFVGIMDLTPAKVRAIEADGMIVKAVR